MQRIGHLSSAHPRGDIRIFLKECRSLARAGYEVSLVVADGRGDETKEGVRIYDVGAARGRIDRMWRVTRLVFEKARALDLDLYHLHDPELIPVGLALKRIGKRVVFDAHEDVPRQILSKPYLGARTRRVVARAFGAFEKWACRRFDAIVTATPAIRDKFLAIHPLSVDVNNYPLPEELWSGEASSGDRRDVCYVGGITEIRGIRALVSAMALVQSAARLQLCGVFAEPQVSAQVRRDPGWQRVDEHGFLGREGVRDVMARCLAGIVTFHGLPNHLDAQPNKMFEYMSAGIPVIASDFPLWRDVVVGNGCGVCVDPESPRDIARAIDDLARNPRLAAEMGEKGRIAVRDRCNWSVEEDKLLRLYARLLAGDRS